MRKWEPFVPGTEVRRVEALAKLIDTYRDPNIGDPRHNRILTIELSKLGILTSSQIAAILGCHRETVMRTWRGHPEIRPAHSVRGKLDPKVLSMMFSCVQRLERGYAPLPEMMEEMTEYASATVLSHFVGYEKHTYYRAAKRQQDKAVA